MSPVRGLTVERPPWTYEAGTPLIAQEIAPAEAVDRYEDIGCDHISATNRS